MTWLALTRETINKEGILDFRNIPLDNLHANAVCKFWCSISRSRGIIFRTRSENDLMLLKDSRKQPHTICAFHLCICLFIPVSGIPSIYLFIRALADVCLYVNWMLCNCFLLCLMLMFLCSIHLSGAFSFYPVVIFYVIASVNYMPASILCPLYYIGETAQFLLLKVL